MTNLRQFMHNKYEINCRCIRCREPKGKKVNWDGIKIKVMEYSASNGKEYFISAEDFEKGVLIGYLRLRQTSDKWIIRELHVYGTEVAIGKLAESKFSMQHKGWGKQLLSKAETLAQNKIYVMSGIGAREYYRKFGYEFEDPYMMKTYK